MSQVAKRDPKDKKTENPVVLIKLQRTDGPSVDKKKTDKASAEVEKVAEPKTDTKSTQKPKADSKETTKKTDSPSADKKKTDKTSAEVEKVAEPKTDTKSTQKPKADSKETTKMDARSDQNGGHRQNGGATNGVHNGVRDVTLSNGSGGPDDALNGTSVSPSPDVDDEVTVDNDELFPELDYDETSDCDEDGPPSRSVTRRSQVKATRTPETPRPASDKQADKKETVNGHQEAAHSKETPKEEQSTRKLRSADNDDERTQDVRRETNYSKSRVKVSPYRVEVAPQDQSTVANYTGNNSTMEMDITEGSVHDRPSTSDDPPLHDSSYVNSLRAVRARRSYKNLKHIDIKRTPRTPANVQAAMQRQSSMRPLCTVVGRKRKPQDDNIQHGGDDDSMEEARAKRMRPSLLQRVMSPFGRSSVLSSTPMPARRQAPIVGINSDLPLSAPVAAGTSFDPETLVTADLPPAEAAKRGCVIV